ncbi:MAG: CheR family methyltransferase [Planctomycetota bacterium]|jgi:chemotaxis protein methyltransferase CheR
MELQQLDQRQFDRFRAFIYERSGIWITDNKLTLLSNRIRRRLKALEAPDFDAYYRHLTSSQGTGELEHFLDSVTTNETFFFRTPRHFEWFKSEFLGEAIAAERKGERARTLRIWSAGCATGAEAYTIAICLLENLLRLRDWSLAVIATDISEEALRGARAGVFRSRAVEEVSEQQRKRFFEPAAEDDCCRVKPEVKELVRFEYHNLMTPMSQGPFDCIFIRNVLIYFDRASKETVVRHLIAALAPGGYLVVGPSEGLYDMLRPLERRTTFLYQKPRKADA